MKLKYLILTSMLLLMLTFAFLAGSLLISVQSLTSHASIFINGDTDFTSANGVTGGSGTALDPYIIEGWDIDASTAHGIEIRNTRAYFIVRNVTVHDGKPNNYYGIWLQNVTSGIITNTTSTNNAALAGLNWVSNTKVLNNTATNEGAVSVDFDSHHNTIAFNYLRDKGSIWIGGDYNNIMGNTLINYGNGITIQGSFNNILDNTLSNGQWYALILSGWGGNNTVVGNDVSGGADGIAIDGPSFGNNITGNRAHHNSLGITISHYAYSSSENYIVGNIVEDNSYGIYFGEVPSSDNFIYNNYLRNSNNARDHGANSWNISKTIGNSIAGGPYLGGNFYSDYAGTDADRDGIGDTPYTISGGSNVDSLPLVRIPNIVRTFNVTWKDINYPVRAYAPNCTLDDFNFNRTLNQISLTVTAGTTRYVNVTVPKELMEGALTVLVDDTPTAAITTWNLTLMPVGPPSGTTSVYVNLEKGIHNFQIIAQFVARLPGDINCDGKVDIKDIAFVAKHFGETDP